MRLKNLFLISSWVMFSKLWYKFLLSFHFQLVILLRWGDWRRSKFYDKMCTRQTVLPLSHNIETGHYRLRKRRENLMVFLLIKMHKNKGSETTTICSVQSGPLYVKLITDLRTIEWCLIMMFVACSTNFQKSNQDKLRSNRKCLPWK